MLLHHPLLHPLIYANSVIRAYSDHTQYYTPPIPAHSPSAHDDYTRPIPPHSTALEHAKDVIHDYSPADPGYTQHSKPGSPYYHDQRGPERTECMVAGADHTVFAVGCMVTADRGVVVQLRSGAGVRFDRIFVLGGRRLRCRCKLVLRRRGERRCFRGCVVYLGLGGRGRLLEPKKP